MFSSILQIHIQNNSNYKELLSNIFLELPLLNHISVNFCILSVIFYASLYYCSKQDQF